MKLNKTLREAMKRGDTKYLSTVACPRGHLGDRYTSNQMCCQCHSEMSVERRLSMSPDEANKRREYNKGLKRQQAAKKREDGAPVRDAEQKRIRQVQAELGLDLPTSREEARAAGSTFYFNGKPCPKGHVTIRRTNSPGCEECMPVVRRDSNKKARIENPERFKEKARRHYDRHSESIKAHVKAYAAANPEKVTARWKAYHKNKPEIYRAGGAKRRARKNQATPPWVTGEINERLKAIYAEAEKLRCSEGHKIQVDHIVPLKNKVVSGLHVPWNLRLATKMENAKKNNKFDPFLGREAAIPLGCGASLGSYQLM